MSIEKQLGIMSAVQKYFEAVLMLDDGALNSKSKAVKQAISGFMEIWSPEGKLTITGPEPIGLREYRGQAEIQSFYARKGEGFANLIGGSQMPKAFTNISVTSNSQAIISGHRTVAAPDGEGMDIAFTHNFHFEDDGKIGSLHLHVGDPEKSAMVPMCNLSIQDMGKLAAVAWMVA